MPKRKSTRNAKPNRSSATKPKRSNGDRRGGAARPKVAARLKMKSAPPRIGQPHRVESQRPPKEIAPAPEVDEQTDASAGVQFWVPPAYTIVGIGSSAGGLEACTQLLA